jgi:ketosteroid isomerase-like protein
MAGEEEAVLFANEAFYQAFRERNLAAMGDVWSASENVACIHPGWAVLSGRRRVLQSWAAIFQNDRDTGITCHGAKAYVFGGSAIVCCYESLGGVYLAATNVFVREDGRWRMVHHQAGPTNVVPPLDEPEPTSNLMH